MRLYNINTGLINVIQNLYDRATSAVCFNGSAAGWFGATVRVRQGCLLSPTLCNMFLERVMAGALGGHRSAVGIGGGVVSDLSFANDMGGLVGSELELAGLVEHLGGASAACGSVLGGPDWWPASEVALGSVAGAGGRLGLQIYGSRGR